MQDVEPDAETLRLLHRTIQKVTEDIERMRFNTAIAAMMEFTNHLTKLEVRPRAVLEPFVLLLAPFAPHLAEELWRALGHATTLAYEPWPKFDPALTKADEIEVPVQVNGKLKARLMVPAEIDDDGAGGRGPGRREGEGADRRQDGEDGEGGAEEAGEHRGRVTASTARAYSYAARLAAYKSSPGLPRIAANAFLTCSCPSRSRKPESRPFAFEPRT